MLLAEDNRVNLKLAHRLLEGLGCVVVDAQNGREALNHLQSQTFDIVFMDCEMPEVNGFEATAEVRRLEAQGALPHQHAQRLPIVALTANVGAGHRTRCLQVGMDDHVTKPVSANDLTKAIRRWAVRAADPRTSF